MLEQFAVSIDQRNQRVRFTRPQAAGVVSVPAQPWETGGQIAGAVAGVNLLRDNAPWALALLVDAAAEA